MINYLFKSEGKLNIRKIIFLFLALVGMVIIFYFSSKGADESTEESHEVGKIFGYIFEYDFQEWTADAQERYAARIDHPIRKTAHFLEYMLLAELLAAGLYDRKRNKKHNILIPFGVGVFYAITDEVHQMIVGDGRAGMVSDVILDSGGVLTGVLLVTIIIFIAKKISKNL